MPDVLALGLVCWITTMILVESELFRPLREVLGRKAKRTSAVLWHKACYLVSCHLCAGTWIALLLVALHPISVLGTGFLGWVLGALLVKALAHVALVLQRAGEAVTK